MTDANTNSNLTVSKVTHLFHYGTTPIRSEDDFLNLTDMWKAAGSPPNQKPADWLRTVGAKKFIGYLAENLNMGNAHIELVRTNRGGTDAGTLAHWQIGMSYGQDLNPEFHAWCNSVVRVHMETSRNPHAMLLQTVQTLVSDNRQFLTSLLAENRAFMEGLVSRLGAHPARPPQTPRPRLDQVLLNCLKEAHAIYARSHGQSTLESFRTVSRECRVRSLQWLTESQAQTVLTWLEANTLLTNEPTSAPTPQEQPARPPWLNSEAEARMDSFMDSVERVGVRTTNHLGKPVGAMEPPFYPREDLLLAALNVLLKREGMPPVDDNWLHGAIRLQGLRGEPWRCSQRGWSSNSLAVLKDAAIVYNRGVLGRDQPFNGTLP